MEPEQISDINYNDWADLVTEKYPTAKIDGSAMRTFYAFLPEHFDEQYSYNCLGAYDIGTWSGWVR